MTETRPGSTGPGHTDHTVHTKYFSPDHHTIKDNIALATPVHHNLHHDAPQCTILDWTSWGNKNHSAADLILHQLAPPHYTMCYHTLHQQDITILHWSTTGPRRVEWSREDAQDGVAGGGCWWCTIWCCTREQSQASRHPVITVPHYTRHIYCNIGV